VHLLSLLMASDSNAAFPQNHPYFQSNAGFSGYNPGAATNSTNDYVSEQNWSFHAERLNAPHLQDQSPALYQGWHNSQQQFQPNDFAAARNSPYGSGYAASVSQYSTNAFGSTSFNRQPNHDPVAFGDTTLTGYQRPSDSNPTYGHNAGHVGTVAPGALQQQPIQQQAVPVTSITQTQVCYFLLLDVFITDLVIQELSWAGQVAAERS